MKNIALLALVVLAAICAFDAPVNALTTLRAFREASVQIVVTPSPVPVGFVRTRTPSAAQLLSDPYGDVLRVASSGAGTYDVPLLTGTPTRIAQAAPQGNIPITFTTKADPTAAFLQIVPSSATYPAGLQAGYGTTVFPCVFSIKTSFTTSYLLTDWGFNTTGTGSGPFPIENAPTASLLSWRVPDLGQTAFTVFKNAGSPGQTTWTGAAGTQTHCIDVQLTVPTSQPAGTYSATIQYNLFVN